MNDGGGPRDTRAHENAREVDDSRLLQDILRAVMAREDAGHTWKVETREPWCVVTPPEGRMRDQGWKLHVSATQLSAPVVLSRVAEVLVRGGCAFKFARGLRELGRLLDGDCDRGSGGKFVTAYPADDERFRELATELDRVTDGLPGPVILSDRRLRPGSLVHYRFGVFGASPVLSNDGGFESMLTAPDGRRQKDERLAWFSPPSWAPAPPLQKALQEAPAEALPEAPAPLVASGTAEPGAVLLGGRFLVREAIRQSYRGGVYRAADQHTGAEVVVKQARPHVLGSLTGRDARDALRHEAKIMDLLGPLGLTPRKVALFTHQENVFLAEESVPGVTLRQWASERAVTEWRGQGAPPAEAVDKAVQLADIMTAVHDQGLVLRDFTPNNLMVTPDGRLRLIDLEHVVPAGSRVARAYTTAYAGREQTSAPWFGPAPSPRSDLFSLGATVFYLVTGIDPLLPADEPRPGTAGRPDEERLEALVTAIASRMPALRSLSPLVRGLMRDDPEERWSLKQTRDFLAAAGRPGRRRTEGPPITMKRTLRDATTDTLREAVGDVMKERLLADGLRHVLRTMTPEGPRLWKAGAFGDTTDPCNVQHGAGGVLAVLTRSAQVLGGDPHGIPHRDRHGDLRGDLHGDLRGDDLGAELREGVAAVAGWIGGRLFDIPRVLPGLYFGRSGTAWALHDAARFLGDDHMAARAVELAKRVPVEWPNPDICHGAAGAGMAQLHLWTSTGDPEPARRAVLAADCVLNAARERDGHLMWPIPATFDSSLAGLTHYGFAHGVAGAGTFLLYAGLATGRPEYLRAAHRAGETLEAVADVEDGAAWWPSGEAGEPSRSRLRHWCSGSSGVGTFLIRLWRATGERRFRDLAEAAAVAIRRDRWYSSVSACHGLAGDGEFLLDLAGFTGDRRYRDWAEELATVMYARHAVRDGLLVLPDESGMHVHVGYNTGLSGALGFLLRLRHGGPRWWMPDELLAQEGRAHTDRRRPAAVMAS
ncbi:class IV lanthionine synthetase LanL [Planotetraspora sp. A-T 1434]|uniref:class IV lanthionine synthetase LanL n=1 Tax=Planotetraspora sp. A-T 1434 TaxID=2979219 RepID=UPI0021BE72FA|nr:class IV lanthionine synthetase LanL [Planotetraspora sp. A-T 1434]MCT9933603.1 class IV lanthionine synthetase LanL [Planotetraspora sp. A-T 1434]